MSFRSTSARALKQAVQAATSANTKRSFSLVAKAAARPQVARTVISVSTSLALVVVAWSNDSEINNPGFLIFSFSSISSLLDNSGYSRCQVS
jgi:hypothetical protein